MEADSGAAQGWLTLTTDDSGADEGGGVVVELVISAMAAAEAVNEARRMDQWHGLPSHALTALAAE